MRLSNFELEVMQLFLRHGELSTPAAHELTSSERDVTYSTVKTIVDRLEAKGAIERRAQHGRTIIYGPAIEATALQKPLIGDFIKRVFGGNRRPLFSQLLTDENLSADDLRYLEALIREQRKARDSDEQ